MKKVLFATTALAGLAIGGMASAQGIALFGDARLGLGYQVDNDGDFQDTEDEFRAISRVRFGVNMTGETESGITFGATIRADNAIGGEGFSIVDDVTGGVTNNQTAGSVFISGSLGTLTYGDIDEAHQNHVGDFAVLGLTELENENEPPYLGNRVGDNAYRPTVRYDYDFAGFGVSLGTGSRLESASIGASYTFDFGGGSFTGGGGYFTSDASATIDEDDDSDSSQWIAGLSGEFAGFSGKVIYTTADREFDEDVETLGFGLGTTFGSFGVDALYHMLLNDGTGGEDEAYGFDVTYDLGGGAEVVGGVVQTFEQAETGDNETIADFGISMAF